MANIIMTLNNLLPQLERAAEDADYARRDLLLVAPDEANVISLLAQAQAAAHAAVDSVRNYLGLTDD